MNRRPNHTVEGIAFIAICLLAAAIIYAFSRKGPDQPVEAAATNTMSTGITKEPFGPPQLIEPASIDMDEPVPEATADASSPGDAKVDNCHGGECTHHRTLSRQRVRKTDMGELVRLEIEGGTSADGADDMPITWNAAPHTVFVFCSTRLPAVMLPTSNGLQTDVLPLTEGMPTVLMSALSIYEETCHRHDKPLFERDPTQLGYGPLPAGATDITVKAPGDIFAAAAALGR